MKLAIPDLPAGYRLLIGRPRLVVRVADIIQIDGSSNYSLVRFADGTEQLFALSLNRMAARLPELMRVHKRHLVNPLYVMTIRTSVLQVKAGVLILTTGEVLPIAKRRKRQVRVTIKAFTR